MRILVTGAGGLLGSAVAEAAERRGHEVVSALRPGDGRGGPGDAVELDVTDGDAVRALVDEVAPNAVAQCAAFTDVERAEAEPHAAMAVNLDGTRSVARAAAGAGAVLLYPSSIQVFSGTKEEPYRPDDPPDPVTAYGRSKKAGEDAVRKAGGRWLIVRTSWLYGPGGPDFLDGLLERARSEEVVEVDGWRRSRPTWTRSLAPALVECLELDFEGTPGTTNGPGERSGAADEAERILHLADRGRASRYEVAREAFRILEVTTPLVEVAPEESSPSRPSRNALLDLDRGEERLARRMPHWKESLRRHLGTQE